jgi:hypothetical protein
MAIDGSRPETAGRVQLFPWIPVRLRVPTTVLAALSSSGGVGAVQIQQSESLAGVQPVGQQESALPPEQVVIGMWRQATLHIAASPVSCSTVQGSPSSGHEVGQVLGGSQVSPAPTWRSPQLGMQSRSFAAEQPNGQQPSSGIHAVSGVWLQLREQPSMEPDAWSKVHALPSSQVRAQAPGAPVVMARSQLSPFSTTPSPQMVGQSLSLVGLHPGAQHLSSSRQAVIGIATHAALQVSARPVTT